MHWNPTKLAECGNRTPKYRLTNMGQNMSNDRLGVYDRPIALATLLLGLLWLPLNSGGDDRVALGTLQIITFVAISWLLLRGVVPRPSPVAWVLLGAGAAAALSTVFSLDLDASVPRLIEWTWLLACCMLVGVVLRGETTARVLRAGLIAAGALQALAGFYVWWGGGSAAPVQMGTFYAPNQYAGYLVLLAPLPLAYALTGKDRVRAAGFGLVAVFEYLAVVLSGSRGGVIAAAVGVAAVLVGSAIRSGVYRSVMRAGIAAAGGLLAAFIVTGPLFSSSTPEETPGPPLAAIESKAPTTTAEMRVRWAQGALALGLERPLAGSGPGTFGDRFAQIQEPHWAWSRFAHNQYLEAFAEGGVPLAAAVIALPAVALLAGIGAMRRSRGEVPAALAGAIAGVLGASVHLLVDHDWSFPAFGLAFVIVASVTHTPKANSVPRIAGALPLLFGLASAGALVSYLLAIPPDPQNPDLGRLRTSSGFAPYSTTPLIREALALRNQHELHEAVKALRQAARLDRLDLDIRIDLARISAQLGLSEDARAYFGEAIALRPSAARPYGLAAEFELESGGNLESAEQLLLNGISRLRASPHPERVAKSLSSLLLRLSEVRERLGDYQGAATAAEDAREVNPDAPEPWYRLSQTACLAGDRAKADAAAERSAAEGASESAVQALRELNSTRC